MGARLTWEYLERRFEEAVVTARSLPPARVQGLRYMFDAIDMQFEGTKGDYHTESEERPTRVRPQARAISEMNECFAWLALVPEENDRRLIIARASGRPWRAFSFLGLKRTHAFNRWKIVLVQLAHLINRRVALDKNRERPTRLNRTGC